MVAVLPKICVPLINLYEQNPKPVMIHNQAQSLEVYAIIFESFHNQLFLSNEALLIAMLIMQNY